MKNTRSEFVVFVEDLFSDLGPGLRTRAMFGGHGVYFRDQMFALIAYDQLYMKVDAVLLEDYKAAGSEPFVYESPGRKPIQMSYWSLPEEALENPSLALEWAQRSLAAAKKTAKKTAKKKNRRGA